MKSKIIVIDQENLYELVHVVLEQLYKKKFADITEQRWITQDDAKEMLGVKSAAHMSTLRSRGLIRYAQPTRKTILYDKKSIEQYLENNAYDIY